HFHQIHLQQPRPTLFPYTTLFRSLTEALKSYKGFGGICFDTQHAFSSGYDIASPAGIKKTFADFEKKIGMKYLAMSHINDSKVEDRKSTRLNSSHDQISYAVFCLK